MITGALVSLLEAVCTGQMYLPTITFILKLSPFKFQAFIYLLLYNLMFILPLLAVFFFALLGMTSQQFAQFMRKNLVTIKVFMAILFFTLGLVLIWKV
jgi:cytochrome c biogenesis protein CcdA